MSEYSLLTSYKVGHGEPTGRPGSPGTMAVSTTTTATLMVRLVRVLYGAVLVFGFLLAAVTLHGMKPVIDPVTPVGILDKISFFMGIHDKSTITVLDLDEWSTTVYTYIFHHHLNDRSFHLAEERKARVLPGIFGSSNESAVEARVQFILETAKKQQPSSRIGFLRLQPNPAPEPKVTLVARVSNRVMNSKVVRDYDVSLALRKIMTKVEMSSDFQLSADGVGTLSDLADERLLQWFAVNLMTQKLQKEPFKVAETAIIVDVGEQDLNVTLGVPYKPGPRGRPKYLKGSALGPKVVAVRRLQTFGHQVVLVTLNFKGLGLYSARKYVYTSSMLQDSTLSQDLTKAPNKHFHVRNGCVNPIIDSYWEYNQEFYHIKGLKPGDTEMVKERNGPFAGKRIKRPVANYNYCHNIMAKFIATKITQVEREQVQSLLKNRDIFMEGLLKEKCIERGLTLPERGGDVKVKALLESLKLACRVPNTDQPFSCIDLMFLTRLLSQITEIKPGSNIRSSRSIRSMTAEWPLGAAFYVHQNGL